MRTLCNDIVMNIESVMEYICEDKAPNLPAEALSEIFSSLIWTTKDNGSEVRNVLDKWIEGSDKFKIEVSLKVEGIFPFEGGQKMIDKLEVISNENPLLSDICLKHINNWHKQNA